MNKREIYTSTTSKVKTISRIKGAQQETLQDHLAIEEPLEVSVRYGSASQRSTCVVAVIMRTPGEDRALALGFAYSEQIISSVQEVAVVRHLEDPNQIIIELNEQVSFSPARFQRNVFTTSSCGMCGKTSIDHIHAIAPFSLKPSEPQITSKDILLWPSLLRQQQGAFQRTGGMHACALINLNDSTLVVHEDVGRHNAVDKLIGIALMNESLPLCHHALQLSGRASFELVQKAIMAGIHIVSAIGAPSSLAVELAEDHGLTLLGFVKDQSYNIYAGRQRIDALAKKP